MAIMLLVLQQDPPRMVSAPDRYSASRASRPGAVCGGDPREVTRYPAPVGTEVNLPFVAGKEAATGDSRGRAG